MNKFQKAWGNIESLAGTSDYFEYRESSGDLRDLSIIQELVDKTTPRKASKNFFGRLACDNCGISFQELGQQTYCKHCGQKLDWTDTD